MSTPDLASPVPRYLYRVPEAAEALGISRATVYNMISAGTIRVVHIGAAVRVPAVEVARIAMDGAA
ncbi:MAG: helix-turn-helix domain-containing protein [Acidobacteria bacterium]|nr:helix-turn-helix domain-containing protein [Acidobacteriota bacterium]